MRLYAFGSNGSGQLGLGHTNDESMPQECFGFSTVTAEQPGMPKRIVAGGNATLTLFDSGVIYEARIASIRAADQPDVDHYSSPYFRKVELSTQSKVKLCSSTWDARIVVTADNEIFTSGSGPKGELGSGEEITFCEGPLKLEGFLRSGVSIVDLASSVSHTVVVLSDGEMYGWGNGRKGQLGEPADFVWTPRKIPSVGFKVFRAVCGREFTYLVGDPMSGRHCILGSDKWSVKSHAPLDVRDWTDIGASWGSIYVLDTYGKIMSWGRNDRGQLAPPSVPAIEMIAAGSEHLMALTNKGKVICWGWGEHGNCGSETDHNGDVKERWNEIQFRQVQGSPGVIGVGAGCATSFLWTQ